MKKLILAPAVALAFTGLVAAPVAAAEAPSSSTQSDSAAAKAEQDKKEKAEKLAKEEAEQKKADEEKAAADKAAKEKAAKDKAEQDKAEQDKKDAAEEAAENAADKKKADDNADEKSGDDAKDSKKPAPKDDGSKDSKKDDSDDKSKDSKDSEDPKDDVEKPTASVSVTSSISAENLADEGLDVTVTNLKKGDKVSVKGADLSAKSTTATGQSATLTLQTNEVAENINEGATSVSIKVTRTGESGESKTQNLTDSVEILAAEDDPKVSLPTKEISVSDFKKDGLKFTGKGFTAGGTVSVKGEAVSAQNVAAQADEITADEDGNVSGVVTAPESIEAGKYSLTFIDDETSKESAPVEVTVTEDDAVDPIDASLKVDPKEITAEDLADKDKGILVTVTNLQAGDIVNDSLTEKPKSVEEDGDFSFRVYFEGDPADLEPGKHTLTVSVDRAESESAELKGEFEVTEDDDAVDPIDASLKVDPKEITAADLSNKDKGVAVTVSGVKKGDKITDSLTGDTETAAADGDYKLHLYYQGNPDSLEEGKVPFTVTIDREGTESETLNGNINVVAEDKEDGDDGDNGDGGDTPEAPAEASFTVSPKTLEAADFANDKKGVTLAVEDCEPGADVHFAVKPKGIQVTAYENTVKADDEGKASVSVFGTSDNVSAYVGAYTASATCGDDTMKESFTVTAGTDGGGSDDGNGNNDGNDGSELPRTGADLGGLASGAMLLLVGGAAIAMTGRRKKVGQSPTDF